jgi:enediyne biosynthesis protein E4
MTHTDEIHGGGSYFSQNDLRLHFEHYRPNRSRRDPLASRKLDALMDLPADQLYSVLEGTGVLPVERLRSTPAAKSKSAESPAIVVPTAPRAVRGGQPPLQ